MLPSVLYSSTTIFPTPPNLLLPKTSLPSNCIFASKISYKVNKNGDDSSSKTPKRIINNNRRDILIGLGTLCGVSIVPFPSFSTALAAPIGVTDLLPRKLDSTIRTQVGRAQKSRSKKQKEEEEEVLNVKMELLEMDKYIKFDVFINEEDDNPPKMRLMNSEYAGSFVSLPHSRKAKKGFQKTSLTLGLTDLIEDLGVDGDDNLEVILVPRAGSGAVVITDVKIDYIS